MEREPFIVYGSFSAERALAFSTRLFFLCSALSALRFLRPSIASLAFYDFPSTF